MEHYWFSEIFGPDKWFNYWSLYKYFANSIQNDGVFVEIGSWNGRSISFLGVYEAVLNDINSYLPKMKKGGIISGHDYKWLGVGKAVRETFGEDIHITPGFCWVKQL